MNIRCDKCNFTFELIPNKEYVYSQKRGRIERTYIMCPKCGKEYDVGYSCNSVKVLLQVGRKEYALRLQKKLRAEFKKIKKEKNNGRRS